MKGVLRADLPGAAPARRGAVAAAVGEQYSKAADGIGERRVAAVTASSASAGGGWLVVFGAIEASQVRVLAAAEPAVGGLRPPARSGSGSICA